MQLFWEKTLVARRRQVHEHDGLVLGRLWLVVQDGPGVGRNGLGWPCVGRNGVRWPCVGRNGLGQSRRSAVRTLLSDPHPQRLLPPQDENDGNEVGDDEAELSQDSQKEPQRSVAALGGPEIGDR